MNIMHSIIVELATKGALGGSDLSRTESRLKGAEASISRLGVSLQDSVGAMSDAFTGVVEMSHIVNLARNPKQSPDSPNYSADR